MSRTLVIKFFTIIALVAVVTAGCRKNKDEIPRVEFTIDMNDPNHPEYQSLNSTGGTVYFPEYGILVGKSFNGYFAVTGQCTAHSCQLEYQYSFDQLKCPCYGCLFGVDGSVQMGPATQPLIQYATQLNGQWLRVYSP
jgi:Rieske Fe-S protein